MNDVFILQYKIEEFNKENKTLKVTFGDGTWAFIRLTSPLPESLTELEEVIKKYAPTVEHMKAQSVTDADLSFIEESIGKQQVCERFTNVQPVPDQNQNSTIDNFDSAELYKVQITVAIQRTLAEMAGATV
jgi:hypothetical protein